MYEIPEQLESDVHNRRSASLQRFINKHEHFSAQNLAILNNLAKEDSKKGSQKTLQNSLLYLIQTAILLVITYSEHHARLARSAIN